MWVAALSDHSTFKLRLLIVEGLTCGRILWYSLFDIKHVKF